MIRGALGLALLGMLTLSACKDKPIPAEEVIANLDHYLGKRVRMKAKLRSGARCRVGESPEDWKTYCKDCQFCNGPYVVDLGLPPVETTTTSTATDEPPQDWPMILGGSHDYKAIRCRGPLNEIACYPFELGKEYVVEGMLERNRPPRLMVDGFQPAD